MCTRGRSLMLRYGGVVVSQGGGGGSLLIDVLFCCPTQLDIAKKCGADIILNPTKVNVVEEVLKLTGGYGCDVYVEATGHPQSVKQG